MRCLSRNKDRINRSAVTGAVKVLQIQSVVPNLVQMIAKEFGFANLEFYWTYRGTRDEDRVNTCSDSRNVEFQENRSLDSDQICLKELDLGNPGVTLIRIDRERAVRRDLSQDSPPVGGEKGRNVSRVIRVQGGERWHERKGSEAPRHATYRCPWGDEMSLGDARQDGFAHRGAAFEIVPERTLWLGTVWPADGPALNPTL